MDVKSAFLNDFINEEVYVVQPPGFIDFAKPNHVYRLKKVLYGLKQALKARCDMLKAFLIKHDYIIGMNGVTKWPTCSSDIDGFYNSGELPGMVRAGSMTYFQDHKWYDELADGRLKEETLIHKEKVKESRGNATPSVIKSCAWLINSFGNFHKLDYNVLVKLQECWWKINTYEVAPFTRLESYGQRPYANIKTEKAHDPYLEVNNIFGRNYDTSNVQDNQGHEERRDDPALEPSVCKIRRFEMMKYSFNADEDTLLSGKREDMVYSEKTCVEPYEQSETIFKQHFFPQRTQIGKSIPPTTYQVIQICSLSIRLVSKHMTENLKLLINFVWKFLGTIPFGNDHVAAIQGYDDLQ
ncbi:putative retrotransposon ty1-copia subclass protein [Tanacetum coccineum]|uniref:Retrotransposon ty1-copia subclass protein n=1 Tax=Tanacetum coccineum TaxID=301880 RepID=A0ABQ5ADD9_9ASTR